MPPLSILHAPCSIKRKPLFSLFLLFSKLGITAFGGPAAHTAMMEDEVVRKRGWMSREHFLDLVGATNLIPGPNSTEMAMHCGHERAGIAGLVVAGLSFLFPATVLTAALAWVYQAYGSLPAAAPFIAGVKPAVIAIIIGAAYRLGRTAVKNIPMLFLGLATIAAVMLGVNEIAALFGAGFLGLSVFFGKRLHGRLPLLAIVPAAAAVPLPLWSLFLSFLKIGALLYGSGYVLYAFLDAEFVSRGIIGRQLLIDAVAAGQLTPGPILSAATFIGWQLSGWKGALVATAGVFLPSFFFIWILNPLIPRMRKSQFFGAFLDAVNVASVAVIAAVGLVMARDAVNDWRTAIIALAGLATTLIFRRVSSLWLVLGGAAAGAILL
jgi:chromate transporter